MLLLQYKIWKNQNNSAKKLWCFEWLRVLENVALTENIYLQTEDRWQKQTDIKDDSIIYVGYYTELYFKEGNSIY